MVIELTQQSYCKHIILTGEDKHRFTLRCVNMYENKTQSTESPIRCDLFLVFKKDIQIIYMIYIREDNLS